MTDRRSVLRGAGALALAAPMGGIARRAWGAPRSLTVTTGHPPVFLWAQMMDEVLLPEINRRLEADGRDPIDFNRAYGTVARPGTELQTIERGISDMGFVSTLFHASDLPLQNVSYAIPFGAADPGVVAEVGDALSDAIPAMDEAFARHDQVALAGAAVDSYHLFTTFPIARIEDLEGRRIAAPGPSANWLSGTGAVPVASNLNEYYNNIQLGVYDGALTFASAAAPIRLQEVAPHVTLADLGAQYVGAFSVGRGVWDGLDEAEQAIFRDAAMMWRDAFIEAQRARATAALAAIEEGGGIVAPLPEAERARWAEALPDVAGDWARAMEGQGLPGAEVVNAYVEGLRARGVEMPRDWRVGA